MEKLKFVEGPYGEDNLSRITYEHFLLEALKDESGGKNYEPYWLAVTNLISYAIANRNYLFMPLGQDTFHPTAYTVYASNDLDVSFYVCLDASGSGDENESYFVNYFGGKANTVCYYDSNDNGADFKKGNVARSVEWTLT